MFPVEYNNDQEEIELLDDDDDDDGTARVHNNRTFVKFKLVKDETANEILYGFFAVLLIGAVILIGWNFVYSNAKQLKKEEKFENNNFLTDFARENSTFVKSNFKFRVEPTTKMNQVKVETVLLTTTTLKPTLNTSSVSQISDSPTSIPTPVSVSTSSVAPTTVSSKIEIKDEWEEKRQFVREMMLDSWNAYERFAWGHEELMPVSQKAFDGDFGQNSGFTLVTSMSTLWTMGLKDKFEKGKKWISTQLDLSQLNANVPVYSVIVNYVGGLLSCYALTRDRMFLDKAKEIGQLLEPAFDNLTGVPYEDINIHTGEGIDYGPHHSYASGFQVDFVYLSAATGEPKYRNQIAQLQKIFSDIERPTNLYARWIKLDKYYRGSYNSECTYTCELFTSLVKMFIQSNYRDVQSIKLYKGAMDAFTAVRVFDDFPDGSNYVRGYDNETDTYDQHMQYANCDFGAMLSMGAEELKHALSLNTFSEENFMDKFHKLHLTFGISQQRFLSKQITKTCQQYSKATKTGLGPNKFYYDKENSEDTLDFEINEDFYHLSHELAESNFILWRLTHESEYRESAWQMAQAIHKHCRVESGGYSGVKDVNEVPTIKNDFQSPIFLSATLKYLYLTFTDDTVLPLDQFVFNSVGHPLPICGNNTMYPTCD